MTQYPQSTPRLAPPLIAKSEHTSSAEYPLPSGEDYLYGVTRARWAPTKIIRERERGREGEINVRTKENIG